MQITYQKNDGCIFHRYRKTDVPYKIGDITSMGWKVLNIEYQYKDKFYSKYDYNMLLQKNKQSLIKRKQAVGLFKKFITNLSYCFIAVLLINFLKIIVYIQI